MPVFCDNKFCTCTNSTIYKFVVIRVCLYQMKLVIWSNKYGGRIIDYQLYNHIGSFKICQSFQYFFIFHQNFSGNT